MIVFIALLVLIFLYFHYGQDKTLKDIFRWNGGKLESFADYISMGTNWEACQGVFNATNPQNYSVVLKSSRWWSDSNTLIEDLRQIIVPPQGIVTQSFGWAGLGAKEYRVYVYDLKGNKLPVNTLEYVDGEIDFCSSLNINDLGLLD